MWFWQWALLLLLLTVVDDDDEDEDVVVIGSQVAVVSAVLCCRLLMLISPLIAWCHRFAVIVVVLSSGTYCPPQDKVDGKDMDTCLGDL